MAKRHTPSVHFSLRLKHDTAQAVAFIAHECAWPDAKALQFLADVGANAIRDPNFDGNVARKIFNAHQQRATAQAKADQMMRDANAAVRAVLKSPAPPPKHKRKEKLNASNAPRP